MSSVMARLVMQMLKEHQNRPVHSHASSQARNSSPKASRGGQDNKKEIPAVGHTLLPQHFMHLTTVKIHLEKEHLEKSIQPSLLL